MIEREIDDYVILEESGNYTLQHRVMEYLKREYVPLGGVSVGKASGGYNVSTTFAQAMVKYKKPIPEPEPVHSPVEIRNA